MKRTLAELALAAVAGGLVLRWWPADGDPFRSSLALVPLVIAALRAVERHGREQGGRTLRPSVKRLEAGVLGLLVLLTLGRRSLGLVATDWFLVAAFLLLLAGRAARLVLALRPCLGRRLPRRPSILFVILPFVGYLAIQPWMAEHRQPDGDEPYYLLLTHSLAHDADLDLANDYATEQWRGFMDRKIEPQTGDPRGENGEVYSRHGALLPSALVPFYVIGGRWGAMVLMALLAAALSWMVLRLAHYDFADRPGAALLAYAIAASSPPLLIYSYQVWIEVPAALLVAVGFDRMRAAAVDGWHRRHVVGFVVVLILLPLLKLRLGLLAVPLFALGVARARPRGRTLALLAGALAAGFGALLLHNAVRYGNLLKIHSWNELEIFANGNSLSDFVRGGLGMLYDAAFGLFPNAPVWMLLLPAVVVAGRRHRHLLVDMAVVALPYLLVLVPRLEWYGGWSPPFRYGLAFLPFLALLLVPLLADRRRPGLRALFVALGAMTVILALIWVTVPGWTYHFADGRTHLLDLAGVRLGADVAQLFPSTVRPRPATWIWAAGSLLLVPIAIWRGPRGPARRRWLRRAGTWGTSALLVFWTLVPLTAKSLPTRVVELEDAWVRKDRGRPFPYPWVPQRTRHASGWILPPAGRIEVPVVAGATGVSLVVDAWVVGGKDFVILELAAGDTLLASWQVDGGAARHRELGPFEWPAGVPLVLRGAGRDRPGAGLLALDRVELVWQ